MGFALLTALCWAFGGFGSSRISRHYGPALANGTRLVLASGILLGIVALSGEVLLLRHLPLFGLAGVLHLSVGDVGLFGAYRRLGPRMGVLMVCSLAPPTALIAEWLLLGTTLPLLKLFCATGILLAVVLAVAPRERAHLSPVELRMGLVCGVIAAVGQGLGAAVSRLAFAEIGDEEVGTWAATLYRVSAGALGVWVWILFLRLTGKRPFQKPEELIPDKRVGGHPWMWMAVSVGLEPVPERRFSE